MRNGKVAVLLAVVWGCFVGGMLGYVIGLILHPETGSDAARVSLGIVCGAVAAVVSAVCVSCLHMVRRNA